MNFDGNSPYVLGPRTVCIGWGLLLEAGVCAERFNRATPRVSYLPECEHSGQRRSPSKTGPSGHAMFREGSVCIAGEGGPEEGSGSGEVFSAEEHALTYGRSNKGASLLSRSQFGRYAWSEGTLAQRFVMGTERRCGTVAS